MNEMTEPRIILYLQEEKIIRTHIRRNSADIWAGFFPK